jgi:hypothetical protein
MQKIRREEAFKFEVNEISWNIENDLFFLTNGQERRKRTRFAKLHQFLPTS